MAEFRHQVLSPEALLAPHRPDNSDINYKHLLINSWLEETTGETTRAIWPYAGCGDIVQWHDKPSRFSRYEPGAFAIYNSQFDLLLESASNGKHTPEPATVVTANDRLLYMVGFDVWGLGQNFDTCFYKGDYQNTDRLISVPEEYWFLKGSYLR